MKKLIIYSIISCCFLQATGQHTGYTTELSTLEKAINKHFYISDKKYYKENAQAEKNDREVSYLWPLCALLQAHHEMEKLKPGISLFRPTLEIISKYYDPSEPAPGYASYSTQFGGGTRFYDDNQWIGITCMDSYARTKNKTDLQTGQLIYRYMMTAYDTITGGGLYWEEGDRKTKNTCSNGPGIILALQLYKATSEKKYLDTALLLYDWVNTKLKSANGLYHDNIKTATGDIGRKLYSYNTGTMLQANVYLYECTREQRFLDEATTIAGKASSFFLANKKFRDNYWFSAVLLRGLQHLYQYNKDRQYLLAFRDCLDNALSESRNENGLMGKKDPMNLVAQAGMLEILARYAGLQQDILFNPSFITGSVAAKQEYDVVVYGGTSAGVTAAVQAARMGKKVLLINSIGHVGGLTSSGLGACDINNYKAVGGLSLEFFQSVYAHYNDSTSWTRISKEDYFKLCCLIWGGKNDNAKMHWMVEPQVAENIFDKMLNEAGVTQIRNERLDLRKGVLMKKKKILAIRMESGNSYRGKVFIDATYEGDLMAKAGASYIVGRESNETYGESRNGILLNGIVGKDGRSIDPYRVEGDPSSGLLPFIEAKPPGINGQRDHRTQAYCYRFTLSMDTTNQVAITKPGDYDPMLYEILARKMRLDPRMTIDKILTLTPIPNKKTDTNHADLVGGGYEWPDGDYATRDRIAALHRSYTLGLIWFLAYDKRVPEQISKEMRKYGLAKDEFADNDNFPRSLYIREARRMISDYVMTEHDYFGKRTIDDPVGLATYRLDTHEVTYFVDDSGRVCAEGVPLKIAANAYPISYRSIRPRISECTNLLVPGCLSSSHSAYSSIRMEPVFMILGQSAGAAAAIAADENIPVQQLSYEKLKKALLDAKQILTKEDSEKNK